MKKLLKLISLLILILILGIGGLAACLTITEYRPADRETAESGQSGSTVLQGNQEITLLSWNTGYAGLDDGADFFMDGGTMVNPSSQDAVQENMAAIADFLREKDADICLLQEIDRDSSRTGHTDELAHYAEETGYGWSYAANYRCKFVPYPLPPMGQMETGIVTMTRLQTSGDAERISLPCPFTWPVRTANIKRCLLTNRFPVEGSDQELVVINLHLEAYDNGEGKIAQTNMLLELLQAEYEKGNYVIAGGDFNQVFPHSLEIYPIRDAESWTPGILEEEQLPEGWRYLYDSSVPSCRLLNQPYDPDSDATQYYTIDGFLVSPNVEAVSVETLDLAFANSDHNPVLLTVAPLC